ncbi:MAG: HemK family protein methyltransferase [Gammaproteobacteria bacterium]
MRAITGLYKVDTTQLYDNLLADLSAKLEVLEDKPEETPVNTLRALWFKAAGEPRSAQAAQEGQLPALDESRQQALQGLVDQRLQGTPLAHLTQRQQFMGIELLAGPEALVPRKETELLGNAVLPLLNKAVADNGCAKVIDVCTGAGNLAIAYAIHEPKAHVYAADLSADAVSLAKRNATFTGVTDQLDLREGDLLTPFEDPEIMGNIDVLSCNPPYISSGKVEAMHHEISKHEPALAFDGGPFGIRILQRLINEAPRFLKPGGWLAFEIGSGQGPALLQRMPRNKNYSELRSIEYQPGDMRVILARRRAD